LIAKRSAAQPSPRLTYLVDFSTKSTAIGRQQHTWALLEDPNYAQCLARARTFTTLEDAQAARDAGLIKGGSPVNALIADGEKWFNAPLRYENEAARHKLLDLVHASPRHHLRRRQPCPWLCPFFGCHRCSQTARTR
jgi:UDP-3-O-acyl-N-acetylglucosamine deacetylase